MSTYVTMHSTHVVTPVEFHRTFEKGIVHSADSQIIIAVTVCRRHNFSGTKYGTLHRTIDFVVAWDTLI